MKSITAGIILMVLLGHGGEARSQKLLIPGKNSFNGRVYSHYFPDKSDLAVTCFYTDSLGFLWIGTYNGILRFDGFHFERIGKGSDESNSFRGKMIRSLCEDSSGNIWFGTSEGLNCYNIRTLSFSSFLPDSTEFDCPDNKIRALFIDREGVIWCITSGDLFSFNKQTSRFKKYSLNRTSGPDNKMPFAYQNQGQILEDTLNNIWFISKGLFMYNRDRDSIIVIVDENGEQKMGIKGKLTSITMLQDGSVWFSTSGSGIYRVKDPFKPEFENPHLIDPEYGNIQLDTVYLIVRDQDSSLWIFGNKLFGNYKYETGEFTCYSTGPPGDFRGFKRNQADIKIDFACQTSKDEILFADTRGLLFRFNKQAETLVVYGSHWFNFHILYDKSSVFIGTPSAFFIQILLDPVIFQTESFPTDAGRTMYRQRRIAEDCNGNLWFTVNKGQGQEILFAENPGDMRSFNPVKYNFPDGYGQANTVHCDREGFLWFTRMDGKIARVSPLNGEMRMFSIPAKTNLNIIQEDIDGNIWLSQALSGVYILKRGNFSFEQVDFRNAELHHHLTSEGAYDIYIDRSNRLWFGTRSGKIWMYDISSDELRSFTPGDESQIATGDICLRIDEDSGGNIWFLFMYAGLFSLDADSNILSKREFGAATSAGMYFDFLIDSGDRFWISHPDGFIIIDPVSKKIRNIRYDLSPENFVSAELSSGNVLIHNEKQLFHFTRQIQMNTAAPEVFITSVQINGVEYSELNPDTPEARLSDKIRLTHRQNSLNIEFTGLSFIEPQNNRYRYFLKGYDIDTISSDSNNRIAVYQRLKPGKYSFWVSSSNNDGIWNQAGKTLDIEILPPFYKTSFAFLLYCVFIGLLIHLLINIRLKRLRSEKIALENQVRLRTRELEEKSRHIEELDRMKTKFFSEISHEIRTPLSLISGPIETLANEYDFINEEQKVNWLEIIRRNSRRLIKLVNQLLDISKLDAGKLKLTLVEGDILDCLRIIVNEYISIAESRKIRYKIDIPDEKLYTFFDRDKIEKIASNLLSNAFKFTPSQESVTCLIRILKSGSENEVGELHFTVADTGVGISAENIDRIFDRFFRIDGQWEKDGTGTGIGLSITREFVSLLHGRIDVKSEPGSGSMFEVMIPLGTDHLKQDEFVIASTHEEEDIAAICLNNNKFPVIDPCNVEKQMIIEILIIEDNSDLRNYISGNLSGKYRILEASDGRTGFSMAIAKIPDLIITDLIIPGIDGMELCRKIRSDERTSHIPVIMLTARSSLDDKIEGLNAGADDYICKPFEMGELRARIENLLALREKLRMHYGMLTGLEDTEAERSSHNELFMHKILTVINECLGDFDFDVGILQERIGMSRVHLYRKVKAITGLSPSMLIRNLRLKRAVELLNHNSENILSISLNVGFSNPSYFARCFRERYGVTPREFKAGQEHDYKGNLENR